MRRDPVKELQRAYKLRAKWKNERALSAFRRAAESSDPMIAAEARFGLAGLLWDRDDIDGASKAFAAVLDSGVPGYGPNAGVLLGRILIENGDLPGAQAAFEKAIEYRDMPLRKIPIDRHGDPYPTVPRDAVNWPFKAAVGLEVVLQRRGDEQGAQQARRLARELADMDEPAAVDLSLGGELKSYGDMPGAKSAYGRAISARHRRYSGLAAHALGGLLKEQGDAEGARAAYQHAISCDDSAVSRSARWNMQNLDPDSPGPPH